MKTKTYSVRLTEAEIAAVRAAGGSNWAARAVRRALEDEEAGLTEQIVLDRERVREELGAGVGETTKAVRERIETAREALTEAEERTGARYVKTFFKGAAKEQKR